MTRFYWHFTWPERIHGVKCRQDPQGPAPEETSPVPHPRPAAEKLYKPTATTWLGQLTSLTNLTSAGSPRYWAAVRDDLVSGHDAIEDFRMQMAEDRD
jgi:hypothetical protein